MFNSDRPSAGSTSPVVKFSMVETNGLCTTCTCRRPVLNCHACTPLKLQIIPLVQILGVVCSMVVRGQLQNT